MRETVPAAVTYGRFDNRVDAIAVKLPPQLEAGARSVRDSLASAPRGTTMHGAGKPTAGRDLGRRRPRGHHHPEAAAGRGVV